MINRIPNGQPSPAGLPADAVQFLQALGHPSLDTVRVRCISGPAVPRKRTRKLDLGNAAEIARLSAQGYDVYFVVNPGGDKDEDITEAIALFAEWDDRSFEEQRDFDWASVGLPAPSLQVWTGGKSIHHYWPLSEPCPDLQLWRALMAQLIRVLGSDEQIKNPSRVMRLPGYRYCKGDRKPGTPVPDSQTPPPQQYATLLKDDGRRFTLDELEAVLAAAESRLEAAEAASSTVEQAPPAPAREVATVSSFLLPGDYPSDSLEEIQQALSCIPPRPWPMDGSPRGDYSQYRDILWGLCAAVVKAGYDRNTAIAMMAAHSPAFAEDEDLERVANSTTGAYTAATFWWHAQQHGYQPPRRPPRPSAAAADDPDDRVRLRRLDPHDLADFVRDYYGDRLRYNELALVVEIDGQPVKEASHFYIDLARLGIKAGRDAARDALVYSAKQNAYHPVQQYLEKVAATVTPVDIRYLATKYLRPDDQPGSLYDQMLETTLIGAVARIFNPGCVHQTACVLMGPQGVRKSTFWAVLGGDWFDDSLGDLSGKDDLLILHRSWIQEWGEIDHITGRKSAGLVKAFLSRSSDTYRQPYGSTADPHPRKGIIVGSTNREEYLFDETGNRRFLTIPVTVPGKIDTPLLAEERDAIWAGAVLAYREGRANYLDHEAEAAAAAEAAQHQVESPWLETLRAWLLDHGTAGKLKRKQVTTRYVLTEVIGKPIERQGKQDQMHVSDQLKRLGLVKLRDKGRRYWGFPHASQQKQLEDEATQAQAAADAEAWEEIKDLPPPRRNEADFNWAAIAPPP